MQRHKFLFLTVGLSIGSLCVAAPGARADTTGSMIGTVNRVTDKSININGDRQTVSFALGDSFAGVFSADRKTKRSLSDVKPGMNVRVFYIKTAVGDAYRKATEIDILMGFSLPLPIPKAT